MEKNKTNETNSGKPKVLACIEVGKGTDYYDLIFTEKTMMVAKTSMSTGKRALWVVLAGVCMFIGVFLLAMLILTVLFYSASGQMDRNIFVFLCFLDCVLLLGPIKLFRSRITKQHEKYLGSPESILLANKNNFEIAYDDIVRVEITPGTILQPYPRIKVVTDTKEYKFITLKKANIKYYTDLLLPFLPNKVQ